MSWIRHKNLFRNRAGGLKSVTFSPGSSTKKAFAHDKDTGRFDSAGSMTYAEGVAKKNESRRQMLDTMKSSGLFSGWALAEHPDRKGRENAWFDKNGVATDLTPRNAARLYNHAFQQLQRQHNDYKTMAGQYAAQYEEARRNFKGPRSWQDMMNAGTVASRGKGPWGSEAQEAYDKRTQDRIKLAIMSGNKSEAARLQQQAQSRAAFVQDAREREAKRMWYGSAQYKAALAQQHYEDQLLAMRADSLNRAGNALMWNAKMAKAFGVDPLKLGDSTGYAIPDAATPQKQQPTGGASQKQPASGQDYSTFDMVSSAIAPYNARTGKVNVSTQPPQNQAQPSTPEDVLAVHNMVSPAVSPFNVVTGQVNPGFALPITALPGDSTGLRYQEVQSAGPYKVPKGERRDLNELLED